MNDGLVPCSPEWIREFEGQAEKRTGLTPADRVRIDADREQRRDRRRAFWGAFSSAMRFELTGPNEIRFQPAGGTPSFGLQGLLRFDPASYRIVHMEYEALRDIEEPLFRLRKGDRFAIDLTLVDGDYYLPAWTRARRQLSKDGQVEEVRTDYTKFRRFASESQVRFADPP